jgi:hypothetical protein
MRSLNIYLKQVYTTNTKNIIMNYTDTTTVNEMITYLNRIIRPSFNFRNHELVEVARREYNSLTRPEEAPALINSNVKIIDYFNIPSIGNTTICFYLREKEGLEEENIDNNCMICYEINVYLTNPYNCSHNICRPCFINCTRFNINNCSLCRRCQRNNI